jgi:hypothetical protein
MICNGITCWAIVRKTARKRSSSRLSYDPLSISATWGFSPSSAVHRARPGLKTLRSISDICWVGAFKPPPRVSFINTLQPKAGAVQPFPMEMSDNSSPRSRSRSPSKSHIQPGGDSASTPLRPIAPSLKPHLPWFTESYFTSEPATAAARKKYIIFLTLKVALVIVFLMAVLSIYWGSLWQTPQHTFNLNNWVVVSPYLPAVQVHGPHALYARR